MSDFFQSIRDTYNRLTSTQQQVADYFLKHPDTLPFIRLADLAPKIGVSTTSVIRFARSLGYPGYSEMQQDLQQSILGKATLPERLQVSIQDSVQVQDQLLLRSFQNDIQNIQETLSALSEETLALAVSEIIRARNIYVLGIRGNFSVAHYLGYRLGQIKPGVHLLEGTAMIYPEQVVGIQPDDVCIAFLTPRYSRMTANLVSWMQRRGIKIILFTRIGHTEIHPYGDIILPCQTHGVSYKSSLTALFCVCNYLLAAVALEGHDQAMETLKNTEELLGQGFFLGL